MARMKLRGGVKLDPATASKGRRPALRIASVFILGALLACSHADADVRKTLAAECASDRDCAAGVACREGMCEAVPGVVRCLDDRECPAGQSCIDGACLTPRANPSPPPTAARPVPGR